MKNLFVLGLLLGLFSFASANPNETLLQQLSQVNAEWNHQTDVAPVLQNAAIEAQNFNQWIAAHLLLVEQTLRQRQLSSFTAQQKQNRLHLLDELHAYGKAGKFPVNDYLPYQNPVFIDRAGTHCAVGYLMMQSGHDALAKAIDTREKFAYVKEIKTPGVSDWAAEHGFTVDELAWIQPGYPPTTIVADLDSGLNGTVNAIAPDPTGQVVYVAGSFSQTISGVPCNNIAAWISGFAGWDWIAMGDGLNGTVNTLFLHNNKLYVGGDFTMAGNLSTPHVAVYDIIQGQWQAMGALDSTVNSFAVFNNEVYAAGKFTGFVSKWNGTAWVDVMQGFIYGEGARCLEVYDSMLVVGGNFELATGALRRHVAAYDGTNVVFLGMGTVTPVNDFAIHKGTLYAACDFVNGTDSCALAAFEDFDWKVKMKPFYLAINFLEGKNFKQIVSFGEYLFACGDVFSGTGLSGGTSLLKITQTEWNGDTLWVSIPLISVDSAVHAFALTGSSLYFGGPFKKDYYGQVLNHMGQTELPTVGIGNISRADFTLQVFPNPAKHSIQVKSSSEAPILQLQIVDALGRKMMEINNPTAQQIVSVENLAKGIYTLQARTQNGWSSTRWVKE